VKSLNKFFIVSASLALLLSACGSNEEASTQEKSQQVQQEDEASVSEEQSDSKDSQANKEPEETESNDVESKGEVTPDKEEPVVEEKTNENVKEKPSNEKSSTESPEDKEQTEVTKEEQEAKPAEEQKDAVSNEKPKEEQLVENPEVQDKELVQSDNQEYAIKVLEGYELAAEEPGRDTVMYKEDGSQFMRIELLSDISEKQAVEVVKQTAMAVDPNASQKASVPAEGKLANAEWYEAKSNDMNVQVIVTKGTKPVKITIFSKSAEQTDKFIEMANTIQ
jgi:DNA mismatch repair ATPase MutL